MAISNTTIIIKNSGVTGNVPSTLANGELAINYADGKLFYKNSLGLITNLSGSGGGLSFGVVNVGGSLILATTSDDTVNLNSGQNIVLTPNTTSKTIVVSTTQDIVSNTLSSNTSVFVNTNSSLHSTVYTAPSSAQVIVDSFSTSTFRSAKYEAQMTFGTSYHVIELRVLHDGTTVYLAQYGEMYTANSLGTFDASITTGTLNLLFNPVNSGTTIKLYRSSLTV